MVHWTTIARWASVFAFVAALDDFSGLGITDWQFWVIDLLAVLMAYFSWLEGQIAKDG